MNNKTIFWFGIFGAFFFIISSIIGGLLIENYNPIKQFISESYAIDTEYGIYIRAFGYIPSGLFMAVFAFSALKILPKSYSTIIALIGFGVFYGLGTIVVGIFPCDSGCNKEMMNTSISQFIHNTTGALTYLIVPICLILIGFASKKWHNHKTLFNLSIICCVIAVLFTLLLTINPTGNYIGLYQRIIEGSILFWLFNFAYYIKNYKDD